MSELRLEQIGGLRRSKKKHDLVIVTENDICLGFIFEAGPEGHSLDGTDFTAYANLFAAAPDLLEAAEMAYEDLGSHEWTDLPGSYAVTATVQKLRAAIAKARGETEAHNE